MANHLDTLHPDKVQDPDSFQGQKGTVLQDVLTTIQTISLLLVTEDWRKLLVHETIAKLRVKGQGQGRRQRQRQKSKVKTRPC